MKPNARFGLYACSATVLAATGTLALAQAGNPFEAGPGQNPFEAGPAQQANPAPQQTPRSTEAPMVFKRSTFGMKVARDMDTHTILAPADWTIEGGAWWPPQQFFKVMPSQDVKATAPDGRQVHVRASLGAIDYQPSPYAQMELGARRPAEGVSQGGIPTLYMPESPRGWQAFLEAKVVRAEHPKATDVRVEPVVVVQEIDARLQQALEPRRQQIAQQNAFYANMGSGQRGTVGGNVLASLSHFTEDGVAYEELFVWTVQWVCDEMQVGRQFLWTIEPSLSFRAREGELVANLPLMIMVGNSVRPTPQYAKVLAQHAAKMGQIEREGAVAISNIIADTGRELSRIRNESNARINASQEEGQRKFVNAMREVSDYSAGENSNVAPVQAPFHYKHVYGNANGEYVMTNDSLYDPNTDPNRGGGFVEMHGQ